MTIIPFPIYPPPVTIQCKDAGDAIHLVQSAHSLCLRASYHPLGGETCSQTIEIIHNVYVMGDPKKIEILKMEMKL